DVTLPDGTVVNNPLRVLVHPDGAEVLFTVRRLGASDADFDRDCATVLADLERLRSVMLAP
ncbi:SRPBCC family protein, partial [Mycobacterium kansasii]